MRVYFPDSIKFFKIKDIDVIGNTNNNTLIGLEPDSFDFINQITQLSQDNNESFSFRNMGNALIK